MGFEIVKRPVLDVGGLVLPNVEVGAGGRSGGLMEFTRERVLERGVTEIVTVFTPNSAEGSTAVVGYRCVSTEQLAEGDVMVRVPAGYFAKFTSEGPVDDPIADVWNQAEVAATEGKIDRAFAEEIEITRAPNAVELYISLA
ncbi:effector binding domain-containing protein [Rhodococcus sp. NPDC127528]|uniref:effector binding domain-containing protein n=1 Tax=unclassified Rhodococcus (in: high G+C Gram-positive bacteria) TaxID=192944 RepID=UPI003629D8EA